MIDLPRILLLFRNKFNKINNIAGEPKSHIVQKHTNFAPERYTAGILYTDSLNSA